MSRDDREAMWGLSVFFGLITLVACLMTGFSGHWTAFGIILGVYLAILGGGTMGTLLVTSVLDALEESRELKRSIIRARSQATVEEINLRHELEMERIRLEKYRVQHELKQMYKEEGVTIPEPVDENPNEEAPRRANRTNRSR